MIMRYKINRLFN